MFDKIKMFKYFPWLRVVTPIMIAVIILTLIITELPRRPKVEVIEEDLPIKVELGELKKIRKLEDFENSKIVALTFDDGPSDQTSRLLDMLKAKDVKVTFFALGNRALAYPELIKREADEGHEVESHTASHTELTKLTEAGVREEIDSAKNAICGAEGRAECISYVRPPYGSINGVVQRVVNVPLMLWSVDSEDWRSRDANSIRDRVMSTVFDGAVILMHDVYESTVTGAEWVIDELKKEDYEFVTVDEMVKLRASGQLELGRAYGRFER